ncbi:MAG: hypothetical protein KatS3mg129_0901 [Leptospiraceae bacterium]|nr:MAG: hypothetical protein KatS3mg129_0901 [Leptospiraceae bacterium]
MDIILFNLENKVYGIEIIHCKEIEIIKHITPINYSSKNFKYYIEGITNIRGEIVTVINLKKLFRLNKNTYKNNLIIRLKNKKEKIGILIDEVMDIINIASSQIDFSKGHIHQEYLPYIKYTAIVNHKPILILNPENL